MSNLAVLFSINEETLSHIRSLQTDDEILDYVQTDIEAEYFEKHPYWVAELDKSWDALHRCLTDGYLKWDNGTYPANHIIMGGEKLYHSDDYIITLKTPAQVKDIYRYINTLTKDKLKNAYQNIPEEYGYLDDEDFESMWHWFSESIQFWQKAAEEGRNVLFTVDQ